MTWSQKDPDAIADYEIDWTDRLELDFDDVELRVLDHVAHFVPVEAPDAVARAIHDAIRLRA